jgi:hypothetical protein
MMESRFLYGHLTIFRTRISASMRGEANKACHLRIKAASVKIFFEVV